MKLEMPRVIKEINRLNWIELNDRDLTELTQNLEEILNPMGFNLSTKLTHVMNEGNDRTFDYKENIHSNWLNIYLSPFLQELANTGDPEIFIKDEIELIENEFINHIVDDVAYNVDVIFKPIIKWDKTTIAFYCHQQKPNAELSDLLYFIFVFEYGSKKVVEEDLVRDILHDFSIGVAKSMYIQELKRKLREYSEPLLPIIDGVNNVIEPPTFKLNWLGTPAQFGFIIQELVGKGYLERPTSSYTKDAALYLSMFDIDTTQGTLAKEINTTSSSLSPENARALAITHIDKLR